MLNLVLSVHDTDLRPHGYLGLPARGSPRPAAAEVLPEGRLKKVSVLLPAIGPIEPLKRIGEPRARELRCAGVQRKAWQAHGGVGSQLPRPRDAKRRQLPAYKTACGPFAVSAVPDSESQPDASKSSPAADFGPQGPTTPLAGDSGEPRLISMVVSPSRIR